MKRKQESIGEKSTYTFAAKVWIYSGPTPWHFVTLPKKLAAEIRLFHANLAKSFGSIAVEATIGKTTWKTSVFAESKSGSYILPLKAAVRTSENISAGKQVRVALKIG